MPNMRLRHGLLPALLAILLAIPAGSATPAGISLGGDAPIARRPIARPQSPAAQRPPPSRPIAK